MCNVNLNISQQGFKHTSEYLYQLSDMAENLTKVPKRGILKASTSFEQREADHSR